METTLKNTNRKDVQLHIAKAYDIIDKYLPTNYVKEVRRRLPKETLISDDAIYNARKKASKNIEIINAMVEVALKYKKLEEKLAKTIN